MTVGLSVAMLAVRDDEPVIAVVPAAPRERDRGALPCGLYVPHEHNSLRACINAHLLQQTGLDLGRIRSLSAFSADETTALGCDRAGATVVSLSCVALADASCACADGQAEWRSWYAYFPWEDWRRGKPHCLREVIEPRLSLWAERPAEPCARMPNLDRRERVGLAFGSTWNEEMVVERYELLRDAGMLGGEAGLESLAMLPRLAHPLLGDHAHVLAWAIAELRRAMKCRPVVFDLIGETFTLFELQKAVEAILGMCLHKQNFRRLVEGVGLVEATGGLRKQTGGRPAQLYKFRRGVVLERLAPGVRIKPARI